MEMKFLCTIKEHLCMYHKNGIKKKIMCMKVLTLARAIFQPEIIKQVILEQKLSIFIDKYHEITFIHSVLYISLI